MSVNEMKNMAETAYNNLLSSHEVISILEKNVYKQIEKSKFAIPSCPRYLARAIYKLRLNTWNTKYSQNMTCVCKNILYVKYILLECPITTWLFKEEPPPPKKKKKKKIEKKKKMDMTLMLATM